MKKIYTLTFAMVFAAGAVSAQNLTPPPFKGKVATGDFKKRIPQVDNSTNRSVSKTFYVDYEFADVTRQETEIGYTGARYIWDMNMRNVDATFKYVVVDYYQGTAGLINDSYGLTDGSDYPVDVNYTAGTMVIDSVLMNIGHENNSGMNDTLVVNVVALTAAGYPTGTVLFTKKLIQNTSFTGATSWLTGGGTAKFGMGYTVPAGTKFGIEVKYYGAAADSFGMIAGFADEALPCAAAPTLPNFARLSMYAQNSYSLWYEYESYGILPTSGGTDIYYPCDANSAFDEGIDSRNFLQNWAVWIRTTADVSLASVEESNKLISKLEQNYPNPFSVNSKVNYSLAAATNVTFTITDLTGKVVMSENYGQQGIGQHTISINGNNLESGIYYYTLTAGASKETRKMTIAK